MSAGPSSARWLCVAIALLPTVCNTADPRAAAPGADPWEWLEQPSPRRDCWLEAQHAAASDYLANDERTALMQQRIERLWNHPRLQVVDIRGDQVFYYWNSGYSTHYDLYSQPLSDFLPGGVVAAQAAPGKSSSDVIDPLPGSVLWYEQSGTESAPALLATQVAPNGRRVAVLLEENRAAELAGDPPLTAAWHILDSPDLRSARPISSAATSLVWDEQSEGVYYAAGGRIYFASMNAAATATIAARSIMELDGVVERLELYGDQLLVGYYPARYQGQQVEWLTVEPEAGRAVANWRVKAIESARVDGALVPSYPSLPQYMGCRREHCYFMRAGESGNGELWQVSFHSDAAAARRVVPAREFPLLQALVTDQEIWLHYLEHGSSVVVRVDNSYTEARARREDIVVTGGVREAVVTELPPGVRVDFLKVTDVGVILSYSGLVTPPVTTLVGDLGTREFTLWQNMPPSALEPESGLSVKLLRVVSPDGTQVPVWVAGQSLDNLRSRPLLLEVYGGFGVPMELMHSVTRQAWMEAGGLYAIAGPRGDGTYGEPWHEAGAGENRTASVADVLAVAADLRQRTAQPILLTGASHGALLAMEAILEQPELFGGLVAAAGVYDLLRFPALGGNWQNEYGDPSVVGDRARLARASPYHHVLASAEEQRQIWPPWLLITRGSDPVVNPAHSYKLHAARVYSVSEDNDREWPTSLLYRASGAGHDATGDPTDLIWEYASRWAFLLRQTSQQ